MSPGLLITRSAVSFPIDTLDGTVGEVEKRRKCVVNGENMKSRRKKQKVHMTSTRKRIHVKTVLVPT